MAPTVIEGIEGAKALVGQELGTSSWYEVTQEKINAFADATGDHNFIHVDEEAAAKTPFGSTIAHGLFTLSLGPMFTYEIMTATNVTFAVNYGYDKVRFPAPVLVNSKVRMRAVLSTVEEVPGGIQAMITQTFEVEGQEKPVCVAEQLVRFFGEV